MHSPDVCIAGAGIIGLTLALELERRGARVTVLERDTPLTHASQAAAGMLAAHDPDNPPALQPLAELSLSLYPDFLARIERLSGQPVPFQTEITFQSIELPAPGSPAVQPPALVNPGTHTFLRLIEHSLDPRQLAPALLAAVQATRIRLLDRTTLHSVTNSSTGVDLETSAGHIQAGTLITTQGAWSPPPVAPRKGQMLSVRIPPALPLDFVLRTPDIYIVPRLCGPHAGTAVIGATVEDAGFSTHTDAPSLQSLQTRAAALIPALAACSIVESWAGLRPHTPDHLPILGATAPNRYCATGHFRNGILLAPATAHVMARLLAAETPSIDLQPFSPHRFQSHPEVRTDSPIFAHAQ